MKIMVKIKKVACIGMALGLLGLMGGCANSPYSSGQQRNMGIGALGGGAIGGAVGGWKGAAIGAAGGAALGGLFTRPSSGHCPKGYYKKNGRYYCK